MNKTTTYAIIILLLIETTLATPTLDWLSPNYDNEVLDEYPQKIRVYARDTDIINNCTISIGSANWKTNISATQAEINLETKLAEGYYNVTTTCEDELNNVKTEKKQFRIDAMVTYQARQEKNFLYNLWIIIFIALFIIYALAATAKHSSKRYTLVISILLLVVAITATQLTKNPIIWIPIIITASMTLYEITRNIR